MKVNKRISLELSKRKTEGLLRTLKTTDHLIDFCSNDYLGLSKNKIQKTDAKVGSGGSRLLSGNSRKVEELEVLLAQNGNMEASLVYANGYAANTGLLSCIAKRGDIILYDKLVHASIRDGIKLSNAKAFSFAHNDFLGLKTQLQKHKDATVFVVIESVYSMDGDNPDFEALITYQQEFGFNLIVDEAHSFGIIGKHGGGICSLLGIDKYVFAKVITFGKSLGCEGAAILGSHDLRNYLINFSRPFIYTTAPSEHKIATILSQFETMLQISNRNNNAQKLKEYFLNNIPSSLEIITGDFGNIIGLIIVGNEQAKNIATSLQKAKLDIRPILSPTVPKGKERLRICFHDFNTLEEVKLLITKLKAVT